MRSSRGELGFTLVEVLVVAGLIVVAVASFGAFFLGGPSPAVASAAHDIGAAFDEARETAVAYDEATIAFTPTGTGYTARVYRAAPGDAQFTAVNGPAYESTVTIAETAAPLGAPGFAFRIDHRGDVLGYRDFHPGDVAFTERTCPATGSFALALSYANQKRTITIPCALSLTSTTVAVIDTPPPAATPSPYAPGTCPATQSCNATLPPYLATCPPGYTPDAQPYVCDTPTPVPAITSSPGSVLLTPPASKPISNIPSTTPSPALTPAISGDRLVFTSWDYSGGMGCDTIPHGGEACGWEKGGTVGKFTTSTNNIEVELTNALDGSHQIDTGPTSASATITLLSTSGKAYCLSQVYAHAATGFALSTPPGLPVLITLPGGADTYTIVVSGSSISQTTTTESSPMLSLKGSIEVSSSASDSKGYSLVSPCPQAIQSGIAT